MLGPAFADAKTEGHPAKVKEAMENYDLLDYEAANKLLNQALTVAKKAKMDSDPVVAQVHLALGIVYYAGLQDPDSAKLAFASALRDRPEGEDQPGYQDRRRGEGARRRVLRRRVAVTTAAAARRETSATPRRGPGRPGSNVDCTSISGVTPNLDTANRRPKMTANLGADVTAAKVAIVPAAGRDRLRRSQDGEEGRVHVRRRHPEGRDERRVASTTTSPSQRPRGKVIAGKGSSGSPNIIEIEGGTAGRRHPDDDENPLGEDGGARAVVATATPTSQTTSPPGRPSRPRSTSRRRRLGHRLRHRQDEQDSNKVQCCFAPALLSVASKSVLRRADHQHRRRVPPRLPDRRQHPGHSTARRPR